jgi:hypothetical protein
MYDPECYILAEYFLGSHAPKHLTSDLAQEIQDAVENWLTSEAQRLRDAGLEQ